MAKKRKPNKSAPAVDYYKLKTQAVDDLVTADEKNSPEVSEEELEKYGARKKKGIPNWLKVGFIKFWFAGAVYFFMVMGLGLSHPLDQIIIAGIVLGMVTDLLTNNMLRFTAQTDGANDKWMMFPSKRYATFLFNIPYAMLLTFLTLVIYAGVDGVVNLIAGTQGVKYLMGEPVTFGLFYMLCDLALVGLKNCLAKWLKGAKSGHTGG